VTLTEVFLGIIAVAVLAMAAGQVAAVVLARRAVRDIGDTVTRLERDVRPIMANVQSMAADAARATAIASAQVERADRLLSDAAQRVEDTMNIVHSSLALLTPARSGMAVVQGIRAAFLAFRELRARSRARPRPVPAHVVVPEPGDDDHASFIG
jgi:hypothetical protein